MVIETLDPGEIVGWSWLFPPYVWHFDARAVDDVRAVAFDGACLRGKCEADHGLGYDLMRPLRRGDDRPAPAHPPPPPGHLWPRQHQLKDRRTGR